jgi:hypothetical protein
MVPIVFERMKGEIMNIRRICIVEVTGIQITVKAHVHYTLTQSVEGLEG